LERNKIGRLLNSADVLALAAVKHRKIEVKSALILGIYAVSFIGVSHYRSEFRDVPVNIKCRCATPLMSQNTVIVTVPADAADLNFFGDSDLL
jgi:hypothetical protein